MASMRTCPLIVLLPVALVVFILVHASSNFTLAALVPCDTIEPSKCSPFYLYDDSCDKDSVGFSTFSQVVGPFSNAGFIYRLGLGAGTWSSATLLSVKLSIIGNSSRSLELTNAEFSQMCCFYSPCATGNNMANRDLANQFLVLPGDYVKFELLGGTGSVMHVTSNKMRMTWYATAPMPCRKGTSSPIGFELCTNCSYGSYQDQEGQTSCKPIPSIGYYGIAGNGTGAIAAVLCEAGFFCVAYQRTECPFGSYQNSTGKTNCNPVPTSGWYSTSCASPTTLTGCASAFICDAGYYCLNYTRTVCPAGTYQGSAGQTQCTSVPTGYYGVSCVSGATGCKSISICSANFYCLNGTSYPCPSGSISNAGSTFCQLPTTTSTTTTTTLFQDCTTTKKVELCENYLNGGSWQLVKYIPAGLAWSDSFDALSGTSTFGHCPLVYPPVQFSTSFSPTGLSEFLFSYGDQSTWLVTVYSELALNKTTHTVLASSTSALREDLSWERPTGSNFFVIRPTGLSGAILYAEGMLADTAGSLNAHQGARVYLRNSALCGPGVALDGGDWQGNSSTVILSQSIMQQFSGNVDGFFSNINVRMSVSSTTVVQLSFSGIDAKQESTFQYQRNFTSAELVVPSKGIVRFTFPASTLEIHKSFLYKLTIMCSGTNNCNFSIGNNVLPTLTLDVVSGGQSIKASVLSFQVNVNAKASMFACNPSEYMIRDSKNNQTLNKCAPLTTCLNGQYELIAPTATSDRMCADFDSSPQFDCSDKELEVMIGSDTPFKTQIPICPASSDKFMRYRIYAVYEKHAQQSYQKPDPGISAEFFQRSSSSSSSTSNQFGIDLLTGTLSLTSSIASGVRWFDVDIVAYDNRDLCVTLGHTLSTGFAGPCYAVTTVRLYVGRWKNCFPDLVRTFLDENSIFGIQIASPTLDTDYSNTSVSSTSFSAQTYGTYELLFSAVAALSSAPLVCQTNLRILRGMETSVNSVGHQYLGNSRVLGGGISVDYLVEQYSFLSSTSLGITKRGGASFPQFSADIRSEAMTIGTRAADGKQFGVQVKAGVETLFKFNFTYCTSSSHYDFFNAKDGISGEVSLLFDQLSLTDGTILAGNAISIQSSEGSLYSPDFSCFRVVASTTKFNFSISFSGIYVSVLPFSQPRRRSTTTTADASLYFPVSGSLFLQYSATTNGSLFAVDPLSFLTIDDILPPEYAGCPSQSITITASAGSAGAPLVWQEPVASDNIGVVRRDQNHYPGDSFSVKGSPHLVKYTAYDAAGLQGTCSFLVIVTYDSTPFTVDTVVQQGAVKQVSDLAIASMEPFFVSRFGDLLLHDNSTLDTPKISFDVIQHDSLTLNVLAPLGERYELKLPNSPSRVGTFFEVDLVIANVSTLPPLGSEATFASVAFIEARDMQGRSLDFPAGWFTNDNSTGGSVTASQAIRIKGSSISIEAPFSFRGVSVTFNYPGSGTPPAGLSINFTGSYVPSLSTLGFYSYFSDAIISKAESISTTGRNGMLALFDDQAPSFGTSCPANISADTISGLGFANVTWTVPTATDNKGVYSLTTNYSPGSKFYVKYPGSDPDQVTYVAHDLYGNSATCKFWVHVHDKEAPTISCPSTVTQNILQGNTTVINQTLVAPLSTSDNSGFSTSFTTNPADLTFGYGSFIVAVNVSDVFGNSRICNVPLEIKDPILPIVQCDLGVAIVATAGSPAGTPVQFDAKYNDNVGISRVEYHPSKNSTFPVGNTQVNFSAYDLSGNVAWCLLNITVVYSGASSASTSSSSSLGSSTIMGIGIGVGLICLIIFVLVLLLVRAKNAKRKPHNFDELMAQLQEIPGIASDKDGVRRPREIKRPAVRILETLGKGNFGEVCKGILTEYQGIPGYLVALKSLHGGVGFEKAEILQEAAIMAQFQHEHVVSLIGVVTVGDPLLVVLEYCEHGSLQSYLQKQDLDLKVKMMLAGDCASGLAYLSERGFVHRDVAARNVLVSSERRAKISDFGMSRETSEHSAYYQSKGGQLPVRWTAPEALEEHKFSSRSDCWSYGVLVYEIWTKAALPYQGFSNQKVWVEVLAGYRLPCPAGCPLNVHELMLECWQTDSHLRPTFAEITKFFYNYTSASFTAFSTYTLAKGSTLVSPKVGHDYAQQSNGNDYKSESAIPHYVDLLSDGPAHETPLSDYEDQNSNMQINAAPESEYLLPTVTGRRQSLVSGKLGYLQVVTEDEPHDSQALKTIKNATYDQAQPEGSVVDQNPYVLAQPEHMSTVQKAPNTNFPGQPLYDNELDLLKSDGDGDGDTPQFGFL